MDTLLRGTRWIGGGARAWALVFGAALLTAPADGWACRTPVYRYAMYNWPAAPGYIFYFHYGQQRPEDEQLNKSIQTMVGEKQAANVVFQAIDASDEAGLKQVPKVVAEHFRQHTDGKSPLYLVYTPWGSRLLAGQLDAKTVQSMFDSPARQRLGELLHQGHACVWIVLSGSDVQAADAAEKLAQEVAQAVAAGKILADLLNEYEEPTLGQPVRGEPEPLPSTGSQEPSPREPLVKQSAAAAKQPAPPTLPAEVARQQAGAAGPTSTGLPADARPRLKAAVLRVNRDDAEETWLVRTLLAVEPDLSKYQKEPMVFPVFGRARVLLPFVGKGITAENLTDCLAYVAGPCSCQVKDENPGFDLLMRWDWETTADALAAAEREDFRRLEAAYMEIDSAQGKPSTEVPGAEPGLGQLPHSAATGTTTTNTVNGRLPPCCQDSAAPMASSGNESSEFSDRRIPPAACCYGQAGSFQSRLWLTAGLVLAGAAAAVVLLGTALLRRPS